MTWSYEAFFLPLSAYLVLIVKFASEVFLPSPFDCLVWSDLLMGNLAHEITFRVW